MKLTIWNRIKICWETLTIKGYRVKGFAPYQAQEKQLPVFMRGYSAGLQDGKYQVLNSDVCIPQKDIYKPLCFGDVYTSFHDCEPCPVFDSCEMKAMTEEL